MAAQATLGLREEFVFFDHGSHGDFAGIRGVFHSDDPALALNADAFGESDFWWKSKCEPDWRTLSHRRIQVKTDTARADVANLRGFAAAVVVPADGYGYAKRETSCCPFLLLRLGHAPPSAAEVALTGCSALNLTVNTTLGERMAL